MEAAALKYKELDGKVDAFGVGGADLVRWWMEMVPAVFCAAHGALCEENACGGWRRLKEYPRKQGSGVPGQKDR